MVGKNEININLQMLLHFICSTDAFKANRAKSCEILRKQTFGTFGESCAWFYEKDR